MKYKKNEVQRLNNVSIEEAGDGIYFASSTFSFKVLAETSLSTGSTNYSLEYSSPNGKKLIHGGAFGSLEDMLSWLREQILVLESLNKGNYPT